MSCLHAYDISTGTCAKCGIGFIQAAYPKDGKAVTWDELKSKEKARHEELSAKQIERYSLAVDMLSNEAKAHLLNLVQYLTLYKGRWTRGLGGIGRDETLESLLGEVNDRLYEEGEIGFETYT